MNSEFSTTEDRTENQSNLHSQDGFAFVECSNTAPEVEFVDTRIKSEPFFYFNDVSDNFDTGYRNMKIKHEQDIEIEETIVKNELNGITHDESCARIDGNNSSTSEIRNVQENSTVENVDMKSTQKRHTCNVCEYATTTSNNLKMHMSTHAGEKLFNCSKCQLTGLSRVKLKEHKKSHTAETLFKCRFCNYTATRYRTLKTHMICHTLERFCKCSHCDYTSVLPSQLTGHMRIHLGVQRYACTACKYSSPRSVDLKVHILKHAAERPVAHLASK